jgi:hypothetical protein
MLAGFDDGRGSGRPAELDANFNGVMLCLSAVVARADV